MNFTKLWRLQESDWWRALIIAILTTPLTIIYESLMAGQFAVDWKKVLAAAITGGIAYILKNLGTGSNGKFLSNKMLAYMIIPILLITPMSGCIIGKTGPEAASSEGVAWYNDIQNWTPYQKSNFLMESYLAEKKAYDLQNAIEKKSPELIAMLKVKREVLEQARIPTRLYVSLVKAGGSPDADVEQQIIDWIRQLQTLALTKVGG